MAGRELRLGTISKYMGTIMDMEPHIVNLIIPYYMGTNG